MKWCNPDTVTMLLSVNHQRHHLFFNREKSWHVWWAQSSFHVQGGNKKESTQLLMLSSVNLLPGGFVSYYLGGHGALQPASLTPEIFISKSDLVVTCLACFTFSWDHSLVSVTKIQSKRTEVLYWQHLIKLNNLDRQREMNKVFKSSIKEYFLT